jgi:potassium-transporting ATPase KdpC subunit
MRRELLASAVAAVLFTALFGLLYPLAMTGGAQVLFPGKADGSRIERDGRTVGSELIAQPFLREVRARDGGQRLAPDPRYFQPRPSVTDYNPAGTAFSNLGPNSRELRDEIAARARAYLSLEGRYTEGLSTDEVPVDAVTASGSSVDPHISEANARIQARRIAAVRVLDLDRVLELVEENTDGRALGFLGEPGVNVLELNLALDEEGR